MDSDTPALGHSHENSRPGLNSPGHGHHPHDPNQATGHHHPPAGADHDDEHAHRHARRSWRRAVAHRVRPHSHDSADKADEALETSQAGIRALWMSLLVLMVTAALQAVVVVISGSVALLGDTIHNVADGNWSPASRPGASHSLTPARLVAAAVDAFRDR